MNFERPLYHIIRKDDARVMQKFVAFSRPRISMRGSDRPSVRPFVCPSIRNPSFSNIRENSCFWQSIGTGEEGGGGGKGGEGVAKEGDASGAVYPALFFNLLEGRVHLF